MKADPRIIKYWADKTKCFMCRHRKDEGHLLPKGGFYPSPKWMFHYEDTHGLPHDMVMDWLACSVYGLEPSIGENKLVFSDT